MDVWKLQWNSSILGWKGIKDKPPEDTCWSTNWSSKTVPQDSIRSNNVVRSRLYWKVTKSTLSCLSVFLPSFSSFVHKHDTIYKYMSVNVLRTGYDVPQNWNNIKFLVFDSPTRYSDTYEQRMKLLHDHIPFFLVILPFHISPILHFFT